MKNLLLSSVLAYLFLGCSLGHYKKLVPVAPSDISPLKPVFGDHFNSFLFQTHITLYGKDFSGLLITKQMQPADYRLIFTTELGMKLFDFEFTDTAFKLHYCIPQFNRPALLKTIQQDMKTILMSGVSSQPVEQFSDTHNNFLISKIKQEHFTNYYFKEKSSGHILKIEHAKKQIKKTTFALENYTEDIPGSIRVQHHNIKLNIELTLLKKLRKDTK